MDTMSEDSDMVPAPGEGRAEQIMAQARAVMSEKTEQIASTIAELLGLLGEVIDAGYESEILRAVEQLYECGEEEVGNAVLMWACDCTQIIPYRGEMDDNERVGQSVLYAIPVIVKKENGLKVPDHLDEIVYGEDILDAIYRSLFGHGLVTDDMTVAVRANLCRMDDLPASWKEWRECNKELLAQPLFTGKQSGSDPVLENDHEELRFIVFSVQYPLTSDIRGTLIEGEIDGQEHENVKERAREWGLTFKEILDDRLGGAHEVVIGEPTAPHEIFAKSVYLFNVMSLKFVLDKFSEAGVDSSHVSVRITPQRLYAEDVLRVEFSGQQGGKDERTLRCPLSVDHDAQILSDVLSDEWGVANVRIDAAGSDHSGAKPDARRDSDKTTLH